MLCAKEVPCRRRFVTSVVILIGVFVGWQLVWFTQRLDAITEKDLERLKIMRLSILMLTLLHE